MAVDGAEDPRVAAVFDLAARAGAKTFELRWSDDPKPIVWMAVAEMRNGAVEAAGALDPLVASMRLLELLLDGGVCLHCRRPTGVTLDWRSAMPFAEAVCWYQYDPELRKFRRGCEGEDVHRVQRDELCPCGSGREFGGCHGA